MSELQQKDLDILKRALAFEDEKASTGEYSLGWRWDEVQAYAAHINRLIVAGLVVISFSSNSGKNYKLTELGREVLTGAWVAIHTDDSNDEAVAVEIDLANMFNDIVGYDNVKELLRESLQLDEPIHVLLIGPPALAKTMFIWDIEQAFGELTMPLLGSATSHAGLWDLIAEKKPRILLVDEIEKMSLTDMAGLLSLMETGRLIRAKVGRQMDIKVKTWVIACANTTRKLPPELMSRFSKHTLTRYSGTEFRQVVTSVLEGREGVSHNDAAEIATRLLTRTQDVRDAVRVARLSKRVGVERAVELLME